MLWSLLLITRYLNRANFSTSNNEMAVDLYFTLTWVWVGLWIAAKVGPPRLASHHAINYKPLLRAGASSGKSPQFLVPKLSTTNWNCNTNQDCQSSLLNTAPKFLLLASAQNCTSLSLSLSPLKLGFDNLCVCTRHRAQSYLSLQESKSNEQYQYISTRPGVYKIKSKALLVAT